MLSRIVITSYSIHYTKLYETQQVHILLDSRPVRSGAPISVILTTSEPGWEPVQAEIQGQSMYMGRLPLLLTQKADNLWLGTFQVPACTHDVMVWQLDISSIFQGLAIALMAGEIASLLISRMAVPIRNNFV